MGTNALPARVSEAPRGMALAAVAAGTVLLFWPSLKAAATLALRDDRYLLVLLALPACGLLLFWNRKEIFARAHSSRHAGASLGVLATLLGAAWLTGIRPGVEGAALALSITAAVLLCLVAFILYFGAGSFRTGLYPLCCLLLMMPPPPAWMDRVGAALQHGSASLSYGILRISGIPVLRHGMQFSLPGLDFEVGPECSGIHSSLALLMIAVVAAYIYLRSGWSRTALLVLTVPVVLLKNALRIVLITTLAVYVNRIFLDGPFHHRYGGLIFGGLGAVLFFWILFGLQKIERVRLRGRPVDCDVARLPGR